MKYIKIIDKLLYNYIFIYIQGVIMKPNEKPLLINLDRNVHFAIKMAAAEKNMSMKSWLMLAIAKALQEQKEEINRG